MVQQKAIFDTLDEWPFSTQIEPILTGAANGNCGAKPEADEHSYELPLIPITVMLAISAALWLKIDATEALIPEGAGEEIRAAA